MGEHHVKNSWEVETCPVCGKDFLPASQHGWKIGEGTKEQLVCTYPCQRAWEKASEKKKATMRKPKRKRNAVRVIETGEIFESVAACAEHFNTSKTCIYKCFRGGTYNKLHMERVVG